VIIDIGRERMRQDAIPKDTMNTISIREWWKKLAWNACPRGLVGECRAIWQRCRSLDAVAQELCHTRLRVLGVVYTCFHASPLFGSSAEQPDAAITQAPSVWELLEEEGTYDEDEGTDDLSWLLVEYLWGEPHDTHPMTLVKLLRTGQTIPLERGEPQSPHLRLETVLKLTEWRRSRWVDKPTDILSEETLRNLLEEWENDYETWMCQSSQAEWHRTPPAERRGYERNRFQNFLFKILGSYDLIIFWLRVPASWLSLRIFRLHFQMTETAFCTYSGLSTRINEAVDAFRDAHDAQ